MARLQERFQKEIIPSLEQTLKRKKTKKGRTQVKLRSTESAYMYVTTKNPK